MPVSRNTDFRKRQNFEKSCNPFGSWCLKTALYQILWQETSKSLNMPETAPDLVNNKLITDPKTKLLGL